MSEELKACPFCGGDAVLGNERKGDSVYFGVKCFDDGCYLGVMPEGGLWITATQAVSAWNTRHDSEELRRLREENKRQRATLEKIYDVSSNTLEVNLENFTKEQVAAIDGALSECCLRAEQALTQPSPAPAEHHTQAPDQPAGSSE